MVEFDQMLGTSGFRDNPYPFYRQLQTEDPVHWCEPWRCWVLTRYQDVAPILMDPHQFSNQGRVTNVIQREYPSEFLSQVQPLLHHFSRGLINVDPPDHTRLRRLVQKTFLPKTLERLRPHVQRLVDDFLDRVVDSGHCDLVADLAFPLPVTVIAELLGVPAEMRDSFKHWSVTILQFQAAPRPPQDVILRSQQAIGELRGYLKSVADERRKQPREDLISELVAVEEAGERLTEDELLSTGVGLLVAGHETTTNLIAGAIWLLLRHPEQLARLRRESALMNTAIEEVLRYESPLQRLTRTVSSEVAVGGRPIKQGQTLMMLLGAANRDPAQFPEPDRFDIAREPNRHIAFGQGIHFCLGAPLARLEAPIAVNTILRRLPNLRLASHDPLEWHSGVMRGLKTLPLCFG
jgi:pimeloyl-[acyl-carrier protein] synthase